MNGKILKVSSNDLYGNTDDREVVVFAGFNHLKYMNRYVIFAFQDKYSENKLCYGSVHLKKDSLVTFSINDNSVITEFIKQYLENNLNTQEYEIIDISNISKVELVSYSEMEFDKLNELDALSIKREIQTETEDNNKKHSFLYFLLFVMLLLLGAIIYVHFNPDVLKVKLKTINCTMDSYNHKIELKYKSNVDITFNKDEKLRKIDKIDIYTFTNRDMYNDFKDNNKQNEYFNITGGYKYNDELLELRIIHEENLIIDSYQEVLEYFKKEGYSCIEDVYYE